MAGKGVHKQLLMICLLSYYSPCYVNSQCYVNRHLATKPAKDLEYRTDEMSLKDIFISILDYTSILKEELPVQVGNLSVTHPGDTTCAMLGLGYGLDFLTTEGKSLLSSIPILTDIIRISGNRFIVPNENVPAHLNITQFEDLLAHLEIQLTLVKGSPPQLFLHMDQDGHLHLESFSLLRHNSCNLGPVVGNIHHSLQNTLQLLQSVYAEVETVLHFFGSSHLYNKLESCLQVSNVSLQVLMEINIEKLDYCITSLANATSPRLTKRSTILSWLFGAGAQLDDIEHNLKDSITHYNNNFAKISAFDQQVVESFSRLEQDISSLVEIEKSLQDRVGDLQISVRLQKIQTRYLFSRLQHESTLHRLLSESKMVQNLKLLSRSLFGSNACHLSLCESSISPETFADDIVKIHREIVALIPTEVALVSCLATVNEAVPALHDQISDITTNDRFLVKDKLFTKEDLMNVSIVNSELYPLRKSDISLGLFVHYSNQSRIFLQCLKEGTYRIDGELSHCSPMKFFRLEESHVLEANNEILRSQMLVQRSHHVKTQWMSQFTFSNVDKDPIPPTAQFTFLHPNIESIFLTPAGQIHVANTSYVFTTVFVIMVLAIACCCYKSPSCRNGFVTKVTALQEKLYVKLTSKEFRDKRELKDLNDKVNSNWDQIERMEGLIAKKSALLAKLPANSPSRPAPPAPPAASAPLDSPDIATAEIHSAPARSSSSVTLGSQNVRRN